MIYLFGFDLFAIPVIIRLYVSYSLQFKSTAKFSLMNNDFSGCHRSEHSKYIALSKGVPETPWTAPLIMDK